MAYFNLDKKRTEMLLNKETKFNIDMGATPQELKDISYKFYIQNLDNKHYNTSSTFPKIIPAYNFEEVRKIKQRYFTESTEDLKAKMEIQSDFLNQQEDEIKKSLQRRREVAQVEEIQKLFDSGLLPDKTDFFSDENQDYIRTLKASGRYQEVVKDKRLEQQNNRQDEKERMLEEKLQVVIDTLLRENDPSVINTTISNAVITEVRKIYSNLTEKQQLSTAKKTIEQTKEELDRLKQRNIVEALGGVGAGAGAGAVRKGREPTQREEIQDSITHLQQQRREMAGEVVVLERRDRLGEKLSVKERAKIADYKDINSRITLLTDRLQNFK